MRLTEEGKYVVEAVSGYLTESKNDKFGIVFEFSCADGTIECTRYVTPNTVERVWGDLETLGFTKKHAEDMDNLDRLTDIIGGHQCQIVCENEEYNGEIKLKVKWINPVGGMRSMKIDTKRGIHALLNGNSITIPRTDGLTSGTRSRVPAPPPPPSWGIPPNTPLTEEEPPF